ncbi:MAG: hypothetical protein K0S80_5109 [Neobacillus sp.]|nr:hypothetical protein [Neobacillus sp.]
MEKAAAANQSSSNMTPVSKPTADTDKTPNASSSSPAYTSKSTWVRTPTNQQIAKSSQNAKTIMASTANAKAAAGENQSLPTTGDTENTNVTIVAGFLLIAAGVFLTVFFRRRHRAE